MRNQDIWRLDATIEGPMLQDVSPLRWPGAKFIGILYKSCGLSQSLPQEKLVSLGGTRTTQLGSNLPVTKIS